MSDKKTQHVRDPDHGLVVFGGGNDPHQNETDHIAWRLLNVRSCRRRSKHECRRYCSQSDQAESWKIGRLDPAAEGGLPSGPMRGSFRAAFYLSLLRPLFLRACLWVEDALAEGRIEIEEKLGGYGVPYSIFKLKEPGSDPDNLGNLPAADARARLEKMAGVSDIVLELAAATVYLKEEGYGERAIKELRIRKPLKATKELIEKATDLLDDLGLPVASD